MDAPAKAPLDAPLDAEILRLRVFLLAVVRSGVLGVAGGVGIAGVIGGAAACKDSPEDWPECGVEEEATAADYSEYGSLPTGDFLVCGELPVGGAECLDFRDVNVYDFYRENVGESGNDNGSSYMLAMDCGPETTRTDACCYVIAHSGTVQAGRPFGVGGRERVATIRRARVWGTAGGSRPGLAAIWTARGLAEHASIASFARFTLALLSLGAPSDLVLAATRAQGDEIEHARLCFSIAHALGGQAVTAGPLDVGGAMGELDPVSVAIALATEGCVIETVAAARAALEAREMAQRGNHAAQERRIAAALSRIAVDEARHAALAWRAAAWLLRAYPETRPPFHDAVENALADMATSESLGAGAVLVLVEPLLAAAAA